MVCFVGILFKKRVNKFPPLHKDTILGMDESMIEEELPDELVMPEAQSEREEKLWKLGDLQGRVKLPSLQF